MAFWKISLASIDLKKFNINKKIIKD
jgi:hypothetical protein